LELKVSDNQLGILWFCIIGFGLYWLVKSSTTKSNQVTAIQQPAPHAPPPPHPLEHLIQETSNFSYIKFDGATVYHYASTSADAPQAIKELKFFRKVLNADKKNISDQLRTIRANVAGAKGLMSIPSRSGLVKGVRFGVRAATSLSTLPLENQKSLYNSLLLQCDRVQIDIERL
jgi:hypothetical protein